MVVVLTDKSENESEKEVQLTGRLKSWNAALNTCTPDRATFGLDGVADTHAPPCDVRTFPALPGATIGIAPTLAAV
jgi:hypothetical protein